MDHDIPYEEIELGMVHKGEVLVCGGEDAEYRGYSRWLNGLIFDYKMILSEALEAEVDLDHPTLTGFLEHIGIDIQVSFNDRCFCAGHVGWGWVKKGKLREVKAKGEEALKEAKKKLASLKEANIRNE